MKRKHYLLAAVLAVFFSSVAVHADTADDVGKLVVYTTFYPTEYFTQRIAGDLVEVVNPVPDDADAISWQPDRKSLIAYQQADLIILNGAEFEKWVGQVTLPEDKIVNTAQPFDHRFITIENAVTHSHGAGHTHSHEGLDGHTWVDPVNAKAQAKEIAKVLTKRLPNHKRALKAGYEALASDLDALDSIFKNYRKSYDKQPIFMSHPAYNYIAKRYRWNIVNLDLDPQQMPTLAQLADINAKLKKHDAKYLIWESEPDADIAERIEHETGLHSIVFTPLELLSQEQRTAGVDYLDVMQQNVKNIGVVFMGEPPAQASVSAD